MDKQSIKSGLKKYEIHKILGISLIIFGIIGIAFVVSFPELSETPEEDTVMFSLQLQYISGLQNEGIGEAELSVAENTCDQPLETFETSQGGYVTGSFPQVDGTVKWCYDGYETIETEMEFYDGTSMKTLDLSEQGQIRFFSSSVYEQDE